MNLSFPKLTKKDHLLLGASFMFSLLCGIFSPGGRHLSFFLTALPWSIISAYSLYFIFLKCKADYHWIWRILLLILLCLATLSLLIRNESWPNNHEYVSFNSRTICYAMHYKECDFFPIWGSAESNNLGEPMPLYYHKLFYHVSAPIYMFTENIKVAILGAIVFFNFIGILGLYKTYRRLKLNINTSFFLAAGLIFQNYYATEIFIRGAMAEFSALMVLPWLIWWCVKFLQEEKYDHKLPLILFAIYLGHSIIAFYAVFMLLFYFVIKFFMKPSSNNLFTLAKNGSLSAIIFGVLLSPIVIVMYLLSEYYDPSTIKFDINNHYSEFINYFFDTNYIWRLRFERYTVQHSELMWLSLLILSISAIYWLFKKQLTFKKDTVFLGLAISLLFFLFLQLRVSYFFYEAILGADYIQFPWRLNCFILVLAFVIIGALLQKVSPILKRSTSLIAGLLLAGYAVGFPMYKDLATTWDWIDEEVYNRSAYYGVWGIGEYAPVVEGYNLDQTNDPFAKLNYFGELYNRDVQLEENKEGWGIKKPYYQEQLQVYFEMSIQEKMEAKFPVNYSGLEVVEITYENGKSQKLETYRTPTDSRIHCKVPPGNYTLIIHLPSYFNLFL